MLLGKSGEVASEEMKRLSKSRNDAVVDVTGDVSKVRCCKEQYYRNLEC